jgi:hypothetical protein
MAGGDQISAEASLLAQLRGALLRAFSSGEIALRLVAAMEKDSSLMANLQINNSGLCG